MLQIPSFSTKALAVSLLCGFGQFAFAADQVSLFPVKGVFFERTQNKERSRRIHEDFEKGFQLEQAIQHFQQRFAKEFTQYYTDKVDLKNQYQTFAVSVQIVRASQYLVPKGNGTVDVFLPLTLSVYFTNILTGEVLYSNTATHYNVYNAVAGKVSAQKNSQLYNTTYKELLDQVLATAKKEFKPFEIEATLKETWKGFLIFDKGIEQGLAKGDTLTTKEGVQVSILHAGKNYAVGAKPLLGEARTGDKFEKFSNQSAADVKKPKALILTTESPSERSLPPEMAVEMFSDRLGSKAAFTLLPFNRNFHNVRTSFIEQTGIQQKTAQERELPDLFIRLRLLNPITYDQATSQKYAKNVHYQSWVFGELVDSSGRVLYADQVGEHITDQVVNNVGFSGAARFEIAEKNALVELAKRFSEKVHFRHIELKVNEANGEMLKVKDPYRVLHEGSSFDIYRNIGKINGISEEVLVPIYEGTVAAEEDQAVSVQAVLPKSDQAPKPSVNDLIVINSVSQKNDNQAFQRQQANLCAKVENLGKVDFPEYQVLSYYALAQYSAIPFYADSRFYNQVNRLANPEYGFKKELAAKAPQQFEYCFEPVYKINFGELVPAETYKTQNTEAAFGLRVKKGADYITRPALSYTLNIHFVDETKADGIRHELTTKAIESLQGLTKQVNQAIK